jgi:hypothetical protein
MGHGIAIGDDQASAIVVRQSCILPVSTMDYVVFQLTPDAMAR